MAFANGPKGLAQALSISGLSGVLGAPWPVTKAIHMMRKGQACGIAEEAIVWNRGLIHSVIAPTCPSIPRQHYRFSEVLQFLGNGLVRWLMFRHPRFPVC